MKRVGGQTGFGRDCTDRTVLLDSLLHYIDTPTLRKTNILITTPLSSLSPHNSTISPSSPAQNESQ